MIIGKYNKKPRQALPDRVNKFTAWNGDLAVAFLSTGYWMVPVSEVTGSVFKGSGSLLSICDRSGHGTKSGHTTDRDRLSGYGNGSGSDSCLRIRSGSSVFNGSDLLQSAFLVWYSELGFGFLYCLVFNFLDLVICFADTKMRQRDSYFRILPLVIGQNL